MPITESRRQSDLEKRLKILRQQVYGKDSEAPRKIQMNQNISRSENQGTRGSDITYLRYDLVKILTLSTLAIGIQLILFIFFERR